MRREARQDLLHRLACSLQWRQGKVRHSQDEVRKSGGQQ